jgi:hypothetical protein
MFEIIDLIQRSPDWFKWRNGGITASDISKIRNPSSMTFANLLKEKLGIFEEKIDERTPEEKRAAFYQMQSIQKNGDFGEKILGQVFFEKTGKRLQPFCIQSKKNPQYRASLDGFDFEFGPFEFKFTKDAKKFKKFKDGVFRANSLDPYVNADYLYQVNWILMLTGFEQITVGMAYENEQGKIEVFFREFKKNNSLIKESIKMADRFLAYLNAKNIPGIGHISRIKPEIKIIEGGNNNG